MLALLRRAKHHQLYRAFQGAAASGHASAAVVSICDVPTQTAVSPDGSRAFTQGSFWDVSSPTRREQYVDLATARHMLPHRTSFVPQFTPHGFQLIPNEMAAVPALDLDEVVPMQLDSVKRKRRLKMKKHKYRKRMKKLRHSDA